jgi:hypothetical protein
MGSDLSWVILGAAGGAVMALLLVALVLLVRRRYRSRADLEAMLAAAHREIDDLRMRLDAATARLAPEAPRDTVEYLITDVGTAPALFEAGALPEPSGPPIEVPDRLVLTATVGAPLVRAAAFAHGVRRALSAESRNRIRFEMRREVRAARKRRRRLVRDHLRQVRAQERAGEVV